MLAARSGDRYELKWALKHAKLPVSKTYSTRYRLALAPLDVHFSTTPRFIEFLIAN